MEYAWTISTNVIPRYDPNDLPLNDNARRIFINVGSILPTVCGGGAYVYAGKEIDLGAANGFAGGITEVDTRSGVSKGALFEGGVGEGVVGGGGYIATTDSNGNASTSKLAYLGGGVHTGAASASAGVVGFSSGAGVYAEAALFGRLIGGGIYANVTSNAACESGQSIMFLGPVSSASPNGGGPFWNWFEIAVAGWVLLTGWRKYLTRDPRTNVSAKNLAGLTVICTVIIGFGVWGLLRGC